MIAKPRNPVIVTETAVYDAELAKEQQHVDRCYERLDELRERARLNLQEYVERDTNTPQSVFEREVFASYSRRRLQAVSASEHQLVFGRLDCKGEPEPLYVGRIGMADDSHRRILIDWRAPVGSAFYRATARSPQGVIRRRTLATRGRRVVDINDDLLAPDAADQLSVVAGEGALMHALLAERGRFMQDIVATIQAEQDEVIRTDPKANVVLTGGPGTGKSVVALHRTAYLMYERSAELERRGVLVVGPGLRFSKYISRVLPSLGETSVSIRSVYDLLDGVVAEAREPLEVARIKGSPKMAKVIKSYLMASYPPPPDKLTLTANGHLVRLSGADLQEVRTQTLNATGQGFNNSAPALVRNLARRLLRAPGGKHAPAADINELAGELADNGRVIDALEVLLPHRSALETFDQMVREPDILGPILSRHFTQRQSRAIIDQFAASARIHVGDIPLIDELDWLLGPSVPNRSETPDYEAGLLESDLGLGTTATAPAERTSDFGHIVVDEAQDLTPMQWRMLARRGRDATWTVVGDPLQATLTSAEQMDEAIHRTLRNRRTLRFELGINYRTPRQIMTYAAQASGLDLGKLRSVRSGDEPVFFDVDGSSAEAVAKAARWLEDQPGSGCFIVVDDADRPEVEAAAGSAEVLWALEAKGLEFDNVILYRPEAVDTTQPAEASLVLIGATRATKKLAVVTGGTRDTETLRLF